MSDLVDQIAKLEKRAMDLKESVSNSPANKPFILQRKYLEALKKFDELIVMQKELYGDRAEAVMKSS